VDINEAAKAIVQFVFRDGPVEDMHAAGKLSQDDMKALNKYLVDNLAFILLIIAEGRRNDLAAIAQYYRGDTIGWDDPDMTESKKRLEGIVEFIQMYAHPAQSEINPV